MVATNPPRSVLRWCRLSSQTVDQSQYFLEQFSRHRDLGHLEDGVAGVALGRKMTTELFLNDSAAQDAIFRRIFGDEFRKYGNVADAAAVRHSGRPLSQSANDRDQLGTRTGDYAARVAGDVRVIVENGAGENLVISANQARGQ